MSLSLALSFLTRFPVDPGAPGPGAWGRAARWFPIAGAAVGATSALAALVGGFASPLVGGCFATAAGLLSTGALHIDGVSDCADGLAVNGDAERRLAVMRDPRAGAVGAAAAALVLMTRAALVAATFDRGTALPAIWLAAVWSRAAFPWELRLATPATPGRGLFALLGAEVTRGDAAVATGLAVLASVPAFVLVPPTTFALGLLAAAVGTAAWHRLWRTHIGGSTGDVCGAAVELRELLLLFALAVPPPG